MKILISKRGKKKSWQKDSAIFLLSLLLISKLSRGLSKADFFHFSYNLAIFADVIVSKSKWGFSKVEFDKLTARTTTYSVYQGFGQTLLGYRGLVLGSSQFQVINTSKCQKWHKNNQFTTFIKVQSKFLIHAITHDV